MKATLFTTMATVLVILAGCSNNENEAIDNWSGEIRLASGVAMQTRANTQATQIAENEIVYAWADKVETSETPGTSATEYIKAWKLTATNNNGFTNNPEYYPTDGSKLNIYALHGNFTATTFEEGTTGFPGSTIVHTVANDQSNNDMKNYLKSDLLYAIQTDVERSSSAVNLTFYHLLSKVEVALKVGKGDPDLANATITIEGTKLQANFTPSKSATMSSSEDRSNMVSAVSNAQAAPVTIGNAASSDFNNNPTYNEAVIVPQTLSESTSFIKVALSDGSSPFIYNLKNETKFESGKKYIYHITVNKTGLEVTSSIEGWQSAGDTLIEGSAEL